MANKSNFERQKHNIKITYFVYFIFTKINLEIGNLVNLKETKRGRTNSNVSDELKSTSSINDILGIGSDEADPDALQDISEVELPNYEPPKWSNRRQGIIRAYAANTNQGISRNYNEDRVSIILNIK